MQKRRMTRQAAFKTIDWLQVDGNKPDGEGDRPAITGGELYPDHDHMTSVADDLLIQVKVWTEGNWSQLAIDPATHSLIAQTEPCRTEKRSWQRLEQMLEAKGY